MALLPARNILDGTALPVTSQMKTALGSLRDYCSDLLGTDSGNKAAARTALGAAASGANTDITSLTNLTGGALVNGASGLGYGTGSGGTVTQATSKSTAVTLNKPCGRITMTADALAASGAVSFVFNNSLIAASDVLALSLSTSGSIADVRNYNVWGFVSFSGVAVIAIKNISGASLSEAVQINFAIIKGSTT